MEEIDIWRTATLLIKQHDTEAGWVAAQRADALRDKPREGEAVN